MVVCVLCLVEISYVQQDEEGEEGWRKRGKAKGIGAQQNPTPTQKRKSSHAYIRGTFPPSQKAAEKDCSGDG